MSYRRKEDWEEIKKEENPLEGKIDGEAWLSDNFYLLGIEPWS
jgi:hypothetical protein